MRLLLLFVACTMCASGCVEFEPASTAPINGRAYFVRHVCSVSSEMWVCDASAGHPVCYAAAPTQSASVVAVSY